MLRCEHCGAYIPEKGRFLSTLRRKGDSSGRKEKNSCWKVV